MKHELKIYPEWYNSLLSGLKTFEVRKDDREPKFAPNDELFLREFDGDKYTGRTISAVVRFVLRGEYCKDGYCIMSVEVLSSCPPKPMTNYDRIKAMSVEELAMHILGAVEDCQKYCLYTKDKKCNKFLGDGKCGCQIGIKLWLESEVEE